MRKESETVPRCVPMSSSCVQAQQRYDQDLESGDLGMDVLRPECDDEGHWSPVQCTGADVCRSPRSKDVCCNSETLDCRCVDEDTGEPIFGLETNMTEVERMTCDCARHSVQLKKMDCSMSVKYDGDSEASKERWEREYQQCINNDQLQFFDHGHLRCEANGNYDRAQCIKQTYEDDYQPGYDLEMCFCFDEGFQTNSNFSLVPISMAHSILDCHKPDEEGSHVEGYYRSCEKEIVSERFDL